MGFAAYLVVLPFQIYARLNVSMYYKTEKKKKKLNSAFQEEKKTTFFVLGVGDESMFEMEMLIKLSQTIITTRKYLNRDRTTKFGIDGPVWKTGAACLRLCWEHLW